MPLSGCCVSNLTIHNCFLCSFAQLSGQEINVTSPDLDFQLENEALPLQLKVEGDLPLLKIQRGFCLPFGFDEDNGE